MKRFKTPALWISSALVGGVVGFSIAKRVEPQLPSQEALPTAVDPTVTVDQIAPGRTDVEHPAFRFGKPQPPNRLFVADSFATLYDRRMRTACWSCEHLTRERKRVDGVDRENVQFHAPPDELARFQATNSDYWHSGYDRGHLVPAGNYKWSQQEMAKTFNLANIAPQVGKGMNRDYWARFEHFVRQLQYRYDDVVVCTGPAWIPRENEKNQVSVDYKLIGNPANVAVPTHFYKVIAAQRTETRQVVDGDESEKTEPVRTVVTAAFVMPNQPIDDDTPLERFIVPQEAVEKATGVVFFDKVAKMANQEDVRLRHLCNDQKCRLPKPRWWEDDPRFKEKMAAKREEAQEKPIDKK